MFGILFGILLQRFITNHISTVEYILKKISKHIIHTQSSVEG